MGDGGAGGVAMSSRSSSETSRSHCGNDVSESRALTSGLSALSLLLLLLLCSGRAGGEEFVASRGAA